jgi:hypothetical protein
MSPRHRSASASHPFLPIPPFSFLLTITQASPKPHFFFFFFVHSRAQIHSRIVPLEFCVGFTLFAGGWFDFEKGFQTLYFRVAHQVFDKKR